MRHLWLFADHWVDASADELEEDELNYDKREARIAALRKAALQEIWSEHGYNGVMHLCELGNSDGVIGWQLADGGIPREEWIHFLYRLASQPAPPAELKVDNLVSGFLGRIDADARNRIVAELLVLFLSVGAEDEAIRILKCAPFRAETWKHLDAISDHLRQRYWRETYVRWERQNESELNVVVDQLLGVCRPRAAFSAVHMDLAKIETKRLIGLLRTLATSSIEPESHFRLDQYWISEAFKKLSKRSDVARDELAQLEFMYVDVLSHAEYGIPTLESELAQDPRLFVQLVALAYRWHDDGKDPPEWTAATDAQRAASAATSYSVLHRTSRIPGTQEDGSIATNALRQWVDDARALGRLHGRIESTDHAIGELLGRCQADPDGVWPCESVRHILDDVASQDITEGMSMGCYNLRGVHSRSEGGQDERALAAQYRGWAKTVSFEFPFTATFLEHLARTYDREAVWHDTDANVRKRLNY